MPQWLTHVRGFRVPAPLAWFPLVVVAVFIDAAFNPAYAPYFPTPAGGGNDLIGYGAALADKLAELVVMFRTILFFVLVIGLLWFVAMFVSGRPAIKPVITCVVAAIMLGGIQVILNTFLVVENDNGLRDSPADMLQY